jgi:hypothetical protein
MKDNIYKKKCCKCSSMLWALNFNIYKYRKLTMIINQLFTTVSSNRVTEKEYKNCPVDFYIFQ